MGNTITRLTHHKTRHLHYEVNIPISPDNFDDSAPSPKSPLHHSPTFTFPTDSQPPPKPLLYPVPEEIITATEKGMISENLLCSSLPSSILVQQQQKDHTHADPLHLERWHDSPEPSVHGERRQHSLDSEDSHAQPAHEHEVLTRRSWGSGRERSARRTGGDV